MIDFSEFPLLSLECLSAVDSFNMYIIFMKKTNQFQVWLC